MLTRKLCWPALFAIAFISATIVLRDTTSRAQSGSNQGIDEDEVVPDGIDPETSFNFGACCKTQSPCSRCNGCTKFKLFNNPPAGSQFSKNVWYVAQASCALCDRCRSAKGCDNIGNPPGYCRHTRFTTCFVQVNPAKVWLWPGPCIGFAPITETFSIHTEQCQLGGVTPDGVEGAQGGTAVNTSCGC